MIINDLQFSVELEDILEELVNQLRANGSSLIQKRVNGPTHIQICCPYHANGMERRPSAGIRKKDGVFHCFACGEIHSLQEVISYCSSPKSGLVSIIKTKPNNGTFINIDPEISNITNTITLKVAMIKKRISSFTPSF